MVRLKRTGKPLGRPPGSVEAVPRTSAWLVDQKNYQLLIHWLSLNLPRRLILEYCEEAGIEVSGSVLGQKLQTITNFRHNHLQEIVVAHDTICALAVDDAQEKRAAFLKRQYIVQDLLYEHMMSDRDASGRTHMVRDYIHLSNAIAELEGFKKGTFDPRQQKAVEALTDYMFGDKDAASSVEPKVTVLSSGELPSGE